MGLISFGDSGYGDELLAGAFVTLRLAFLAFAFALAFGTVIGIFALGRNPLRRMLWTAYASIAMGVPSILFVFFIYYNAPILLTQAFAVRVDVSPFMAGLAALVLVYAAYVAEVVRGAVVHVPQGQWDAAHALGVPRLQLWWFIVLPQACRIALPGLANIWMTVLKDTALVSLVGLTDLIRMADVAAAVSKLPFFFYTLAALVFIVLSGFTMLGTRRIERWTNRSHANAEDR